MTTRIYVMYDEVAEESSTLFHAKNDAAAIRIFQNAIKREDGNPNEFNLYCMGSFESEGMNLETWVPEMVRVSINMELEDE